MALPALFLAVAAAAERPRAVPVRVPAPPVIDGRLDDAVWASVPGFDSFVQKFPDEGAPATEQTQVRVAYDDVAVYVAFDCPQRLSPVVARLARRDHPVESDLVEVDLDTRGDGRSAFSFAVNAAGVVYDSLRFNDTDESTDWDENWRGAASRTAGGWSVEMAIPLRVLRFPRRPVQEWGMQLRRHVSARQETDEWAPIGRAEGGEVSRYGRLGPFDALAPADPVEVAPFVVGGLIARDRIPGEIVRTRDGRLDAGADAKWHPRQDLVVDATVNPDFAQVEADELVLNLTTYETFFPEKRPFFLEGTDVFDTPTQVLYTRRIGHVPDAPALLGGEQPVDAPVPDRIWGAAKVSGSIGGTTTGILSAITARQDVTIAGSAGGRASRAVDPLAVWQVVRVKRDLGEQGTVGFIGTAALRDDTPGLWPRTTDPGSGAPRRLCPDGSLVGPDARCTHDAFVGGVDGRWRSPGDDYVFAGQLLGSKIEAGPPRTLLDGTVVRAGDGDAAFSLSAAKQGGAHWIWDALLEGYGRRYDPNDAGYLDRQDALHGSVDFAWRSTKPNGWSLDRRTQVELYRHQTLDRLDLATGYQLNERGTLSNFWQFFAELHDRPAHFDDRELGNGVALEHAGLWGLETSLTTDPRRALVLDLSTQDQRRANGWHHEVDATIDTNLHPQLGLGVGVSGLYDDGEPRFVGGGPGERLFGRLSARSVSLLGRASWTFSPTLTLQTYAQLFAASEHYGAFSVYGGSERVIRLRDLLPSAPPADSPDFQEEGLNANAVLRWEWRPGSTLFLVYTRSSSPIVDLAGRAASLDLARSPRGPAANALQMKLSWWWG